MAGKTQVEHLDDCMAEGITLEALKKETPPRITDWFVLVNAVSTANPQQLAWLDSVRKEYDAQEKEKRFAGRKRDGKLGNYENAMPFFTIALDELQR